MYIARPVARLTTIGFPPHAAKPAVALVPPRRLPIEPQTCSIRDKENAETGSHTRRGIGYFPCKVSYSLGYVGYGP
jgi:hypothetical protein